MEASPVGTPKACAWSRIALGRPKAVDGTHAKMATIPNDIMRIVLVISLLLQGVVTVKLNPPLLGDDGLVSSYQQHHIHAQSSPTSASVFAIPAKKTTTKR